MHVRMQRAYKKSAYSTLSRIITKLLSAFTFLALLWVPDDLAYAQQAEVIERGQELFFQKCAICHGLEGKGDGELGLQLKKQPADLSQLSKANAGIFPFWQIYSKIDGREDISAHGPGDMPIWGSDDRYEGTGGKLAMGQILVIVFFLESVQEK